MTAAEAIEAMQLGIAHARHRSPGCVFAVYLDDVAAAVLLEHIAMQDTRIADLTARIAVLTGERDRARALVAGLIEQPDHHEGPH